jgi:hypothetical protein
MKDRREGEGREMEDEGKQDVGSKQGQVRKGERKMKEERRMYTVLHRQMQMQSKRNNSVRPA